MAVIVTDDEIRSDISDVFAVKRHPSRGDGWALSTRPPGYVATRREALATVRAADENAGSRQTRFIVFRAARGVPSRFMPLGMEGRWENRPEKHESLLVSADNFMAVALPTGRVEHRESDGASAEVWEVHPRGGQYDPDEWGLPE